ncbi:(Na+)-NQR maturation NqrM [Psittacicella hinzii]|uniref:(Na+)-NQR maturation NqrM n=1 Tax=Psittacicella hinzii TaxID=2028575 RepID=A0A3A1YP01_9GAMM|nr:(Na+)-NQR maturation NqrM [Psittacicella hinzii]RIY40003.1 hypothetical protein CKF58_01170 [Psittacicella hinzii]
MYITFILTFVILLLVVAGASIGVMFKRKPIQGSCGGLDALGIAKACSCKTPCSQAQERMAKEQLDQRKAQGTDKLPEVDANLQAAYVADRTGEGKFTRD